jgi:hypothetical protein
MKSQINTLEKEYAITFIPSYALKRRPSHLMVGTLKKTRGEVCIEAQIKTFMKERGIALL